MSAGAEELGYDPQPDVHWWRGTPIPDVRDPLRATPRRRAIAERVFWHGPAWAVLRNASTYLWQVMDFGEDEDVCFTLRDVSRARWVRALEQARPGALSRGSYVLFSLVFGLMEVGAADCDWPYTAHIKDWRPLADQTRERMYERARVYHEAHKDDDNR